MWAPALGEWGHMLSVMQEWIWAKKNPHQLISSGKENSYSQLFNADSHLNEI